MDKILIAPGLLVNQGHMVKAVSYLTGPKAQHEGNRLLMASKMIEFGFEKGAAYNLPGGRVEVLLEGPKEKIIDFYNMAKRDFESWVKAKAKDGKAVKEQFGNPGVRFTSLDFDEDLLVHRLEIYGHSLTFDQIYKGVDVYKDLKTAIYVLNESQDRFQETHAENTEVLRALLTELKKRNT